MCRLSERGFPHLYIGCRTLVTTSLDLILCCPQVDGLNNFGTRGIFILYWALQIMLWLLGGLGGLKGAPHCERPSARRGPVETLAWSLTSLPRPARFSNEFCDCGLRQVDDLRCVSSFSCKAQTQKVLQNPFWLPLTAPHHSNYIVHSFIHSTNIHGVPAARQAWPEPGIYPWGEFIWHKLHQCVISGQNSSFLTEKTAAPIHRSPVFSPQPQPGVAACFLSLHSTNIY